MLAFAACVAFAALAAAAPDRFPEATGFLNDFAGIVDPASADSITTLAQEIEAKTGAEMAVVTLADLGGETIEPASTRLFAQWGIGKKGKDEGILILLALAERKVRIEPGYGLEGILPDGKLGGIIRRIMAPDLSAGRYGPGLLKGARAVAGIIAADRGVTITGSLPPSATRREAEIPGWVLLLVIVLIMLVVGRAVRFFSTFDQAGPYRDWRSRRRGPRDPWGGFGGGWGGMGGFGGGFGGGGGGGGGGFGGFGGGRSGGGGASGGF